MNITQRRPLIVGNWKMNGRQGSAAALAADCVSKLQGIDYCDVAVCPPHIYLQTVAETIKDSNVRLGAQDVSQFSDDGAHTGEVSADMLADMGCGYLIIGHSERRQQLSESDETIAKKVASTLKIEQGVTPIVCVGEDSAARERGDSWPTVRGQLESMVKALAEQLTIDISELVIAYEPIWAIGSGQAATPDDIQSMLGQIRTFMTSQFEQNDAKLPGPGGSPKTLRLLYGGSLKPANASEILALPDVDGGLIGGAALDAQAFADIVRASAR